MFQPRYRRRAPTAITDHQKENHASHTSPAPCLHRRLRPRLRLINTSCGQTCSLTAWPLLLRIHACNSTAPATMTAAVTTTVTTGCGRGCEGRGSRVEDEGDGENKGQATTSHAHSDTYRSPIPGVATYAHIGRCLLGFRQVRWDPIMIHSQRTSRFLILPMATWSSSEHRFGSATTSKLPEGPSAGETPAWHDALVG